MVNITNNSGLQVQCGKYLHTCISRWTLNCSNMVCIIQYNTCICIILVYAFIKDELIVRNRVDKCIRWLPGFSYYNIKHIM